MAFQSLDLFGSSTDSNFTVLGQTNCVPLCTTATLIGNSSPPCFMCADYPISFTLSEVMQYRWKTQKFHYVATGGAKSTCTTGSCPYTQTYSFSFDMLYGGVTTPTSMHDVVCGGNWSGTGFNAGSPPYINEGFFIDFSVLMADRALTNESDFTAATYYPSWNYTIFNHDFEDLASVCPYTPLSITVPIGHLTILGKTVQFFTTPPPSHGSRGIGTSYNATVTAVGTLINA